MDKNTKVKVELTEAEVTYIYSVLFEEQHNRILDSVMDEDYGQGSDVSPGPSDLLNELVNKFRML